MLDFNYYAPTYYEFGRNSEENVGNLVQRFGGEKVLIHYGGGSIIRSGLLSRVKKYLDRCGLSYVELGGVQANPESDLVYQGIELCKKENVDFILAVGGGSTIDSAKGIAIGALYDGDFWDFYSGKRLERALPVGTVLTIAAAGSEGSNGSVITKEEGMLKRSAGGDAIRPVFSVLNPALTQTLPAYQTACGIVDIMAHLLERYFTNTKDVEVTDRLIEGLLLAMVHEAPKVIENPNDYEARANIMWAGMLAHNNCCGVGRDQDWASHDIEHELSALYDCAHGAGLAVVFPAWMEYNMNHDVSRFVQLATRVWGCDMDYEKPENTAKAGIKAFREFLRAIGMPQTLAELGGKAEDIPYLAHTASYGNGNGGTLGGFVVLKEKDIENIYRLTI